MTEELQVSTAEINLKKMLLDGWIKTKGQERTEIHISHIIHCAARSAFEILDPNPPPPDERKLHYFISGQLKHLALQDVLGPEFICEKEISYVTKKSNKIIGHVDAMHLPTKTAIEFKTTESVKVCHDFAYPYHISRLMMYQSILGYDNGVILYLVVGHKVNNYFPEYHLRMSLSDRQKMLNTIEKKVDELQFAIDNKNPNLASSVANNITYFDKSGDNWFCDSCPYKRSCTAYQEVNRDSNNRDEKILIQLNKLKKEVVG